MLTTPEQIKDRVKEYFPGGIENGFPFNGDHFLYLEFGFQLNFDEMYPMEPGYSVEEALRHMKEYPDLPSSYGVCDSPEQFLTKFEILEEYPKHLLVCFDCVKKADQPSEGGWRWHKWGEYVGDKSPIQEYLYDEDSISEVYCYHIYDVSRFV